jgi:hypothetical protein
MIRIVEIDLENVGQAMQLVTESLDIMVKRGWLKESELEDRWMQEYEKFLTVVGNGKFVGLLGYQNYNQPIAISLVQQSHVYEEDRGLWEWFYVSSRMRRKGVFPFSLAAKTVAMAKERGAKRFAMFIDARSQKMQKIADFIGLSPVEIEYHAEIDKLNPRLLEKANEQLGKKAPAASGNGRRNSSERTGPATAGRS